MASLPKPKASRDRYQPDSGFVRQTETEYIIAQHILAAIIGVIAIGLPAVLLLASIRYTCAYNSISHFYYSRFFGDVFVGSLVVIGTFLIAYRGENRKENLYASIAGICAYGVAVFPTIDSGYDDGTKCIGREFYSSSADTTVNPFELFRGVDVLHYGSAALLFAFLAYYSLRVFTRVIPGEQESTEGNLSKQKATRNGIYYTSGTVILLSMAAMGAYAIFQWEWWNRHNLTFWFEAFAIWAFGVSWIVKGRFFGQFLLDDRDRVSSTDERSLKKKLTSMAEEQEANGKEKHCPKCASAIPAAAIVCPVCHSDIRTKTEKEIRRERWTTGIKFARDWITVPAALVALIALIGPARDSLLRYAGSDGADLSFRILGQDFINVGVDDVHLSEQSEIVDITVPFIRIVIVNKGLSPANLRPQFQCYKNDNNTILTGIFDFIDIDSQKIIKDGISIPPRDGGFWKENRNVFVNAALRDSFHDTQIPISASDIDKCKLLYADKYNNHVVMVDTNPNNLFPISIGEISDRRVSDRARFCPDIPTGILLGSEPIDCVSPSHLMAIEPIALWERALSRAIRQVDEFRRVSQDSTKRTPAIILDDCDNEFCGQHRVEMLDALSDFTLSVTVWLCQSDAVNLHGCKKMDFPGYSP